MYKGGVAGSDDKYMSNVLENYQGVFQSDYTILHSHQQA